MTRTEAGRRCNLVDQIDGIPMNESERGRARMHMQAGISVANFICRASAMARSLAARGDGAAALLARPAKAMFDRPAQRVE